MSLVATAHAPVLYREPLCQNLLAAWHGPRPRFTTYSSLDPISTSHTRARDALRPMVSALVLGDLPHYGKLARLEFIWDPELDVRGVLLIDSYEQLIVHVVPAHLAFRGPELDLARDIAVSAGVPRMLFGDAMDTAQANGVYGSHFVVLSRQLHFVVNGEDLAESTSDVNDEWSLVPPPAAA